jgi:hypothetical protein
VAVAAEEDEVVEVVLEAIENLILTQPLEVSLFLLKLIQSLLVEVVLEVKVLQVQIKELKVPIQFFHQSLLQAVALEKEMVKPHQVQVVLVVVPLDLVQEQQVELVMTLPLVLLKVILVELVVVHQIMEVVEAVVPLQVVLQVMLLLLLEERVVQVQLQQ